MDADFAVELGPDDATLEFPWPPEAGLRYYDLRRHPDLIAQVEEAQRVPELREFLMAMNSPDGVFETAKCDAWSTTELNPEEEIFGAQWKFGSYVDLLSSDPRTRSSFPAHEQFVKQLTAMLKRAPDLPSSAEFIVRRCYLASYKEPDEPMADKGSAGTGVPHFSPPLREVGICGSNQGLMGSTGTGVPHFSPPLREVRICGSDQEPKRSTGVAARTEGFYITFYLFGYGDDEAQAHRQWGVGLKLVQNAIKQAGNLRLTID